MTRARQHGPSTRAVHAGLADAAQGAPLLAGPVLAAPYHLRGPIDATPYGYGRNANPTWTAYEDALSELEGGRAVVFASGMAATAAVLATLRPGDVLVAAGDAYPGVRSIAAQALEPIGVEVRLVPTDDRALRAAARGATLVWAETPSNPGLELLDVPALAAACRSAGARLVVDGTLAGPLAQQALALGADAVVCSASKHLTGHSDLILGYLAVPEDAGGPLGADALRAHRTLHGAIPGPFETWLAHRSLATLQLRQERQQANAAALAALLADHPEVADLRWPGSGTLLAFSVGGEAEAQRFLDGCELVAEATSFGGVHSTAERRARWATDAVGEGFIRFSCGIEDAADLLDDVQRALAASRA